MPINAADTCRTYVLPKLYGAGWEDSQISDQKSSTDGRTMLVGNRAIRRPQKEACSIPSTVRVPLKSF
jgi:type I restriction enzyme, R subunit